MEIAGKHVRRRRLVETPRYVIAVEVDAVIPDADPSEPCYLPQTVQFLREVAERAERGDLDWLRQHGKVYQAVDAGPV